MLVFVSHPVAGIHRVPAAWLDGLFPSGYRLATVAEITFWHEERGLDAPAESERPSAEDAAQAMR
jgi:hypothetical protein